MTELKIVSSLEKIFAHGSDDFYEVSALSMLRGERLNFQLAVRSDEPVRLTVDCDGALSLALFNVRAVPTQRAYCEDHDDDVIFSPDGIYYPDVLMPMKDGAVELTDGLTGVWCECECQKAGAYPLRICLHNDKDEVTAQAQLTVTVLQVDLPEQTLMCTHWFHCDCIATWYGVEPLSEEHWALLENYVRTAVRHGINFLLTPLFTPPLDTAVGHERPTVQLVDVTVNADGSYTFGFDKLRRWFAMAKRCGVKYFEMSHLFTQWGAAHAPKIVDVNGKKLFGWKTPAGGKAYREFLTAFAAALKPVLEQEGVRDVCYFHVSDEPGLGDLRSYAKASRLIGRLFEGFHRIDAIGTVSYIAQAAEKSTSSANYALLINIMAFITINIGVFNLLPLPALDGGRLFFMVIEMVFRKPVPAKYENLVHAVGLILLLIFMAVVSFSDIYKLIAK